MASIRVIIYAVNFLHKSYNSKSIVNCQNAPGCLSIRDTRSFLGLIVTLCVAADSTDILNFLEVQTTPGAAKVIAVMFSRAPTI